MIHVRLEEDKHAALSQHLHQNIFSFPGWFPSNYSFFLIRSCIISWLIEWFCFLIKMAREKGESRGMVLKFGVALALSIGGILFSFLRTKRISKPSQSPPSHRPSGTPISTNLYMSFCFGLWFMFEYIYFWIQVEPIKLI